jgi:hypothetical protein
MRASLRISVGGLSCMAVVVMIIGCGEMAAAQAVFWYKLNDTDAAALPFVPDRGGADNNGTADAGLVLSADVPRFQTPVDYGNRSIDGVGTAGVTTTTIDSLDNQVVADAGGFSYETWFKWNGGGNINSIIDYAGTEKLVINPDLRMRINGLDSPLATVSTGQWHYAAVVFDTQGNAAIPDDGFPGDYTISGVFDLYLDGTALGTTDEVTINGFGDSLDRGIGVAKHPLGFGGDFFDGLVYSPRVTLGALAESELLYAPTFDGALKLTVDRGTGAMTVSNDTGLPVDFASYSVLSPGVGALEPSQWSTIAGNTDAPPSGDGSVDPNNTWSVSSSDPADLSEGSDGVTGATLGTDANIELGAGSWLRQLTEDLSFEYRSAAGDVTMGVIEYVGDPIVFADLNFDGEVDETDFFDVLQPNYRNNVSGMSVAQAYQLGDLNGDLSIDVFDALLFNEEFLAANPGATALSLTAVPEPSTLVLLGLAGALGCLVRSRRPTMGHHAMLGMLVAVTVVLGLFVGSSAGQTVFHYRVNDSDLAGLPTIPNLAGSPGTADATTTLNVDVPTNGVPDGAGNRSIDGTGVGGVVSAGTYELNNQAIAGAGGFSYETWFKWNGGGNINSIIDYAGTEKLVINPDLRMRVDGLDSVIGTVDAGEWYYTAAVFDTLGNAAEPDPGFAGENMIAGQFTLYLDGISVGTSDVTISGFGDSLNRAIGVAKHPLGFGGDNFDGLVYEPRVTLGTLGADELLFEQPPVLTLEVNSDTGSTRILNSSANVVEMDLYRITSDSDSLLPSRWNSLQDQGFDGSDPPGIGPGWEELGALTDELSELYLGGSSALASDDSVALGRVFNTAAEAQDVVFEYHSPGLPSTALITGAIEYVTGGVILGDVNGDGEVNGLDVDPFVDALLSGSYQPEADMNEDQVVNGLDVDPFVAAVVGGGTQQIPEPSTLLLALVTLGVFGGWWKWKRAA